MKYLAVIVSLLLTYQLHAQKIDQARMKKDIEVAENVLASVLEQKFNRSTWTDNIQGNYIDDYGVIFTIPVRQNQLRLAWGDESISIFKKLRKNPDKAITLPKAVDDEDDLEELQEKRIKRLRDVSETFFRDYAFLINQLTPEMHILLNFEDDSRNISIAFFSDELQKQATLSASILKKDLDAFQSGTLDETTFFDQIDYAEGGEIQEKDPELELFLSIFQRVYQKDLTDDFMILGEGTYSKVEGLGTIINFQLSNSDAPTQLSTDAFINSFVSRETTEKRKTEFNELHATFLPEFQENILNYTRTLKTLNNEDKLIFRLYFPGTFHHELTEIQAPQQVLIDFHTGKLSKTEAFEQFKITKVAVD